MLRQDFDDVLADEPGAHIVEPKLDDAGQRGAGLKQEFGEVEVLRENHRLVRYGPAHDVHVRGVGRPKLAPVTRGVSVLLEPLDPRDRQAIINDDRHAG